MFLTLILQYLNKLVEGKVRDLTTPQVFHTVKVQRFNRNRIKLLTKFACQLPMKVFALVRDLPVKSCKLSDTTPPVIRTFLLTTQCLVGLRSFFKECFKGWGCCIFSPVLSVKYASFIPKSAPTLLPVVGRGLKSV